VVNIVLKNMCWPLCSFSIDGFWLPLLYHKSVELWLQIKCRSYLTRNNRGVVNMLNKSIYIYVCVCVLNLNHNIYICNYLSNTWINKMCSLWTVFPSPSNVDSSTICLKKKIENVTDKSRHKNITMNFLN
jgi:hypothetical protein